MGSPIVSSKLYAAVVRQTPGQERHLDDQRDPGPALWLPFARQEPRLHRRCRVDARARCGRERRHLQRPAGRRPARPAVPRCRPHRGDVDEEHPPEPARRLLVPEFPRLERTEQDVRADGSLHPAGVHARHAVGRSRRRADPDRAGRSRLLRAARHGSAARPHVRGGRLHRHDAHGDHQPPPLAAALRRGPQRRSDARSSSAT